MSSAQSIVCAHRQPGEAPPQGAAATPSRERIYNFIVDYKRGSGGATPSVREIMHALKLSSGAVTYHLDRLIADGRIVRDGWHISIPGERWTLETVS